MRKMKTWKPQLPVVASCMKKTLDPRLSFFLFCCGGDREPDVGADRQLVAQRSGQLVAAHRAQMWASVCVCVCKSCVLTAALNHRGRYNIRPDAVWHCLTAQIWMDRAHTFNCDYLHTLSIIILRIIVGFARTTLLGRPATLSFFSVQLNPHLNFSQHFCDYFWHRTTGDIYDEV